MPDETVETRHPWLDFSLPRRPCLGISVLYSIILQTLNSCAIRPPDRTACPHHRLTPLTLRYNVLVLTCGSDGSGLSACMWEALILRRFPLDTLYSPEGMQCVLKKIMKSAPSPCTDRLWICRGFFVIREYGTSWQFIIFFRTHCMPSGE